MKAEQFVLGGGQVLVIRPPRARSLLVLAHGAGAGMRHAFMERIAAALATHDIATLRWEFPYMAAGKKRPDRPEAAEAAVRAIWNATRARFGDELELFAGGKSFGGRMTSRAHASSCLPGLRGLVFLGFPLHPAGKGPRMGFSIDDRPRGRTKNPFAGPEPGTERAEHLGRAAGPLLFIQGTRDQLADLALLRPVIGKLGRRAQLVEIEGADHGFDRRGRDTDVIDRIASTIAAWIDGINAIAR